MLWSVEKRIESFGERIESFARVGGDWIFGKTRFRGRDWGRGGEHRVHGAVRNCMRR